MPYTNLWKTKKIKNIESYEKETASSWKNWMTDLSSETMGARRKWHICQVLKEKKLFF